MGRKLLLAMLALIVAVPWSPAASAAQLDPSFGTGGRVFLPGPIEVGFHFEGPGFARPLDDGRVLVPSADELTALLPSGGVDASFGEGGSIVPQAPPGRGVSLSSFTVDPLGRPILVGFSSPLDAEFGPLGDRPSQAFVQRFTGDGRLDPSFGGGDGTLLTDFGLPPAEPGLDPEVAATSATLDGSGRIVVRGTRAEGLETVVKGALSRAKEQLLARLTVDGEVDRTFAGDGVLPMPGALEIGAPTVDRGGGIFTVVRGRTFKLIHLDRDGHFDPGFGKHGGRPTPLANRFSYAMAPFAVQPPDRLLLSIGLPRYGDTTSPRRLAFKRLLPDGSLDRGFGRGGVLTFRFPRLKMARIALDQEGRFLIAMTLEDRGSRREAPPSEMALARLRADGSLDPSFAPKGVLPIPLPRKGNLDLESLTLQNDETALIQAERCGKKCRAVLVRVDLRA